MKALFFPLLLLLSSCLPTGSKSKLTFIPLNEEIRRNQPQNQEDVVTYDMVTKKLFQEKCLSCHSHEKWKNEGEAFLIRRKWVVPGNADKSRLFDSVKVNRMPVVRDEEEDEWVPADPLSTEELELIRNYIDNLKPLDAP